MFVCFRKMYVPSIRAITLKILQIRIFWKVTSRPDSQSGDYDKRQTDLSGVAAQVDMKGDASVMDLPVNMIAWVAMITIFAVIMMFILGFLVQFQTIQKNQSPSRPHVTLLLWFHSGRPTIHPNVLTRGLGEWGGSDYKLPCYDQLYPVQHAPNPV